MIYRILPDATRTASGTPTCLLRDLRRGLRRELPSHLRTIVPTMVQTLARTFIGVLWDASRQLPGHVSDVARKLRGCCVGRHAGCCAEIARPRTGCGHGCGLTADWSWTGRGCGHSAGHSPASARTLPVQCPDASRMLPGCCAAFARLIRRTLRRTPRRMLRGLRRQLRSHLPTIVPTIVPTLARTFTGAW